MATYQVIIREGITGGFVGPTVKQMVEIRGNDTDASIRQSTLKPESKTDYTTMGGSIPSQQVQEVLAKLKEQLQQLPLEEPAGSEDIYGQDISIGYFSEDFQWQNGGPEGCVRGTSSRQATPEQKEIFKSLVETLRGLGQQYAVQLQD
ncbi:hypothetical protein EC973_000641 [Apophysomyces ossiformis]|uniref:Uncharacterized protein n=1 Tax=Apophysomyces ossiformis TaxID=679940 RepID=A0A8H7ESW6_9FUNG|nr:hypothetical protein EC973_000641 [Apophysomyces ossiformis]